jgi:hypothetical protein
LEKNTSKCISGTPPYPEPPKPRCRRFTGIL